MNFQKGLQTIAFASWFSTTILAEDWPQWRGPNRDYVLNETGILKRFPAEGLNLRWRVPVGPGWTSPVVVKGRVYVSDMWLEKPKGWERMHCLEETTGKLLWTYKSELVCPEWAFTPEHGGGPAATPIVENGKLYSLDRNGAVRCLDAVTGKIIWEADLKSRYEIAVFSCRGSPLIEGNLLIVLAGGKPGAYVVALDKTTGKEVWKALDEPVASSSPIVIEAGGKRQLIVWTCSSVNSLNPLTGEIFWKERFVASSNDAIPTPMFQKDRLLVSGVMFELDLKTPAAKVIWPDSLAPSKSILSNTSNPMWRGDHIYSAKSNGELVCLEAATGRQLWERTNVTGLRAGASIHLAPVAKSDDVFLFTDEGNFILARLTPEGYHESRRTPLLRPTSFMANQRYAWTPPSYANGHVFARNDKEVVCASLK